MNNRVGFEYRNRKNGKETVYEIFLRYTNEKEKSSAVLGEVLGQLLSTEGMTVLDIGSGNGEFLKLSLDQIKHFKGAEFVLLEPSSDLVKRLWMAIRGFPITSKLKVVHSTFEEFRSESQFDIILASHLPFARDILPVVFGKMLDLLKPKGCLIVVLRGRDDVHEFRTRFKSQLMGRDYQSLTIYDAAEVFDEFAKAGLLRVSMLSADSELCLPIADNIQDAISIIEFFLTKRWVEFPDNVCEAVLDYVNQRKGVLRQTDCFLLIRKT